MCKDGNQIGPGGSSLTTSSGAPVWLDMNGRTRKVTVQAHVRSVPDSQAPSGTVVVIYDYAEAKPVSGHNPEQIGAPNGRLDNPFVIELVDSAGHTVADQDVIFSADNETMPHW